HAQSSTMLDLFYPIFLLSISSPPILTLFPYTTLFRSLFPRSFCSFDGKDFISTRLGYLPMPASVDAGIMCCSPEGAGCESNSTRSEEHTSELQSRGHLVCRLLLEKKKIHSMSW